MPAAAQPNAALGGFNSLSFDPQGKRTVTSHSYIRGGNVDCRVRVWDNDTGELLVVMEEHSERATHATFSPDGRRILSASSDRSAKVWDAESGVCLFSLDGHETALMEAIFSPDGCYIATA